MHPALDAPVAPAASSGFAVVVAVVAGAALTITAPVGGGTAGAASAENISVPRGADVDSGVNAASSDSTTARIQNSGDWVRLRFSKVVYTYCPFPRAPHWGEGLSFGRVGGSDGGTWVEAMEARHSCFICLSPDPPPMFSGCACREDSNVELKLRTIEITPTRSQYARHAVNTSPAKCSLGLRRPCGIACAICRRRIQRG